MYPTPFGLGAGVDSSKFNLFGDLEVSGSGTGPKQRRVAWEISGVTFTYSRRLRDIRWTMNIEVRSRRRRDYASVS